MTKRPIGDAMLSSYDMRLWGLVQHVLHTWGTLVMFKHQHYVVPESMGGPSRGYITFFVPLDDPQREEIVAFLEHELADLQTEDHEFGGVTIPGTDIDIEIVHFGGICPYTPVDQMGLIIKKAYDSFMARLKREGT